MTMIERAAKALYDDWLSQPDTMREAARNGPHPSWERMGLGKGRWLQQARIVIEAIQTTALAPPPEDVMQAACEAYEQLQQVGAVPERTTDDAPGVHVIAAAILAERKRCADVARIYMGGIIGSSPREDEPERIAATVLAPAEQTADIEALQDFIDKELDGLMSRQ